MISDRSEYLQILPKNLLWSKSVIDLYRNLWFVLSLTDLLPESLIYLIINISLTSVWAWSTVFDFIICGFYPTVYHYALLMKASMRKDRCWCQANWWAFRKILFDFITYGSFSSAYNYVPLNELVGSDKC